jgi:lysophospholipase L1-like esterase
LFLVLNVILAGLFFVYDRLPKNADVDARIVSYREKFADYDAYAKISRSDASAFLDEQDAMASIGFRYEPWVQFRQPSVQGQFLNTDSQGRRATLAPAERKGEPLRVYVFGGSTTFGYGVPDNHTIPSYMQRRLEERYPGRPFVVRNFGQPFYYSSQEQLTLLSLLKDGDIPDYAVFVDGGNDTSQLALRHDMPRFTPALSRLWDLRNTRPPSTTSLSRLPMARLAEGISRRLGMPDWSAPATDSNHFDPIKSDKHLSEDEIDHIVKFIVTRYRSNMRVTAALCREFGARYLFVWQPHPGYKYDRTLHKTFPFEGDVPTYYTRVYAEMESYRADFYLSLADMTEHGTQKAYVDDVHYNETLNEQIAGRIVDAMRVD